MENLLVTVFRMYHLKYMKSKNNEKAGGDYPVFTSGKTD
jgi:hypothetical protein